MASWAPEAASPNRPRAAFTALGVSRAEPTVTFDALAQRVRDLTSRGSMMVLMEVLTPETCRRVAAVARAATRPTALPTGPAGLFWTRCLEGGAAAGLDFLDPPGPLGRLLWAFSRALDPDVTVVAFEEPPASRDLRGRRWMLLALEGDCVVTATDAAGVSDSLTLPPGGLLLVPERACAQLAFTVAAPGRSSALQFLEEARLAPAPRGPR